MKCKDLFSQIEHLVPLSLQESYDNCGLQLGDPDAEITGILYSLDVTETAIDTAKTQGCNLVISHHPLFFRSIKNINTSNSDGHLIVKCLQNNIAVYSMHTNFDKYPNGVSSILAQQLGLSNISILAPEQNKLKKLVTFCPEAQAESVRNALFEAGAGHIGNYDSCSFNTSGQGSFRAGADTNPFVGSIGEHHFEPEIRIETVFPEWKQHAVISALLAYHPYEEVAYDIYPLENAWNGIGLGSVGQLNSLMDTQSFLNLVKSTINPEGLRHSHYYGEKIQKVAVCGGSGASLLPLAIQAGAHAFITSDVKYHDFQNAAGKILLIDAGHFETEIFTLTALKSLVSEILPNFAPQIIAPDSNWVNTV